MLLILRKHATEVLAPCLYKLLMEAFIKSNVNNFDDWLKHQDNTMFGYWYGILDLEITLLMFVRSLREANFMLFIGSMKKMLPMFFASDHDIHNARWLPVFIDDLEALTVDNPTLFKEFQDGKFVVKRSISPYSKKTFDQKHEQNNKTIKSESG